MNETGELKVGERQREVDCFDQNRFLSLTRARSRAQNLQHQSAIKGNGGLGIECVRHVTLVTNTLCVTHIHVQTHVKNIYIVHTFELVT